MKQKIMEEVHESIIGSAHGGFEWTYGKIANGFFWPKMTQDIWKFTSTCPICQKIKHARHLPYGLLQPIPIPTQPFEVVTMDFISELPQSQGHNSIFVLICKLTKYAFFIPCDTNLTEKLQSYSLIRLSLMLDFWNKSSLIDLFWKEVCKSMGSRRALTTAYHPQAKVKLRFSTRQLKLLFMLLLIIMEISGRNYYHTSHSHTTPPLILPQSSHLLTFYTDSILAHPSPSLLMNL